MIDNHLIVAYQSSTFCSPSEVVRSHRGLSRVFSLSAIARDLSMYPHLERSSEPWPLLAQDLCTWGPGFHFPPVCSKDSVSRDNGGKQWKFSTYSRNISNTLPHSPFFSFTFARTYFLFSKKGSTSDMMISFEEDRRLNSCSVDSWESLASKVSNFASVVSTT